MPNSQSTDATGGRRHLRVIDDETVPFSGGPLDTASAGGGGDGGNIMEGRIAKLESDVGHIQKDIDEIKGDIRSHLWLTIGAVVILGGMLIGGYFHLAGKLDSISSSLLNLSNAIISTK